MFGIDIQKLFLKCFIVTLVFVLLAAQNRKDKNLIYILQWISNTLWYLETGQSAFISRNCTFQNCFIVNERSYFNSIIDYDVILFNLMQIPNYLRKFTGYSFPNMRAPEQFYVFFSIEPASWSPLPSNYNDFFNITWTYKFSSDIFYPYFVVRNVKGEIVGPKVDMHWVDMEDLPPTNASIIEKLVNKSIAAAWVVSHCDTKSRFDFVHKLEKELAKFGHKIDIYGACGYSSCPRIPTDKIYTVSNCTKMIERDYYFYLAFENSIGEDYVTEKVLHGLKHYSVPIVFGGANYRRYLPDGIYLDAIQLGVKKLAKEMNDIINDKQKYYDYFKWHGFYTFHDVAENLYKETVCSLCAYLNEVRNKTKVVHNMTAWWNSNTLPVDYTLNYPEDVVTEAMEYATQPVHVEKPNTIFGDISNLFNKLFFDEDT